MNLSRAFSIFSQRQGKQNISVDRVMTPTMALVVRRDDEIKNFIPIKFFSVQANFSADKKIFSTTWQIPENFSTDSEGRLLDFDVANSVLDKLKNCSGIGTEATRAGIIEKTSVPKFFKTRQKNF